MIPQVRILTICDIFDALTAEDRPYRRAQAPERASAVLRNDADRGALDGDLVELFVTEVVPRLRPAADDEETVSASRARILARIA